MTLVKLCEETKRIMVTQLIGLGEAQGKIYDQFNDAGIQSEEFVRIYELHCRQQELLIKYQNRTK